ncbi:MAG TPA: choice-of-anchor Q domain-containing protein, partial [Taishania sp.]|nr:choice-of-anchor Q domain-containing protein [Taishania sp.]
AFGIIYVKPTATGTGDGSSWTNATSDLHNAIHATGVSKVFVAIGNFNVGTASFIMKNNVEIYGGFDPDNSIDDLTDSRILPTESITGSVLNGENNKPLIWNDNNGLTATAILDGFTLMNGKGGIAGAIYNNLVAPTYNNLVIRNNEATTAAGGIYNLNAPITLKNSIISNNTAPFAGGVRNNQSNAVFTNVIIKNNSATMSTGGSGGGGIFNESSDIELTNVLIANNSTNRWGGGFRNLSGNPVFTNVTLVNNTAVNQSATTAMEIVAGTPQFNNTIVLGTISGTYTPQYSLIEGNTDFTNGNINPTGVTVTGVFTDPANGDYTLKFGSVAVNSGNNALNATTTDLAGNTRVQNTTIDLGAYESAYAPISPDVNNILYVDINVTGGNGSGDSWVNAIPQLAEALKYARLQYDANNTVYDTTPLKIYVAKGTYKPMYNAADNYYTTTTSVISGYDEIDNAFVMVKNVQIYGGFDPDNGIDDLTDTRIFGSNGSILSGDVAQTGATLDNARHVVISSDNVGNAVLDGFTIRDAFSLSGHSSAFITVNGYPVDRNKGAMVCVRSSPTIANCTFTKNYVSFLGGGITNYQQSSPTITNCVFKLNSAENGGAIANITGCSPIITNCSFIDNGASVGGGAIYNTTSGSPTTTASSPIITNCSFTNNKSDDGGAIYNSSNSSPVIVNTLFVNNIARGENYANDGNGGAIYNNASSPTITNVSIANNLGANAYYSTGTGSTTINNSIVFGTISATYTPQYSLIEGNTDFTNGNINPTGVTVTGVFTDPANGDYTLKFGSVAVNSGNNALNATTTDLAGNTRVQNTTIDLGAYESAYAPISPDVNNILYVDINVTGGNGSGDSWENAIPQLADALKYARLQYNADNTVYDAVPLKIYVAKGTYKPLYSARNNYFTQTGSADPAYSDQDNAFVMVKNVQIYGGFDPENNIDDLTDTRIFGSNGSILSGDIGDIYDINYPYINANHVMISSGDVGNALLNGFTITRAFSESTNAMLTVFIYPVQDAFGAMYCVRSSPTVENCIFTDNHTSGGNMFNYQQSSPTIINCTFINNGTMGSGGAIYNSTNSSPTITNCSFTGNSAYEKGGAIYNYDNSSPIITNCSFKNNQSGTNSVGNGGGAIYNSASSPIIANSLFANNKAMGNNYANPNGNGGAIYNVGTSSPVLTNVTIADNLGATTVYSTGTGSTTFNNSIVYGGISATYVPQYSLIEGNTDFTNGNINPTGVTVSDIFTNPTDSIYTLQYGSVAVNSGNNALNATTTDLAGNARIIESTIDMGAYEYICPSTIDFSNVIFSDSTLTYDGTIHSLVAQNVPSTATITYEITDAASQTIVGNSATNAGVYTVDVTLSDPLFSCNTVIITATLTINKAAGVITANSTQTHVYDGTVKNVVATLNHSECPLVYTPQQGYTDVGVYSVTVTAIETDNYLSTTQTINLEITKAVFTGITFNDGTFNYDGNSHSIDVVGAPVGATVTYTITDSQNNTQAGNSAINVGVYTVEAVISMANYEDLVLEATLTIQTDLGTKETDEIIEISIYPNPFNDVLKISNVEHVQSIVIYDLSNRLIKKLPASTELNLSDLSNESYILELIMENNSRKHFKVIKQ